MNRQLLLCGDKFDFCGSFLKGLRSLAILFLFNFLVFSLEAQQSSLSPKMPDFNFGRIDKETVDYELWKAEPFGKYNPADEIIEKRDQFSKHFRQADGSIVAHIAAGPIHYWENGQWKTIFHAIQKGAKGFINTTNAFKTYYPENLGQPLITTLENGEELKELIGLEVFFEGKGQKSIPQSIQNSFGNYSSNELTYTNAFGNSVDLRLTQHTLQRKMDFIIRNSNLISQAPDYADFMVFREIVELPVGWTAKLENNEIKLYDSKGKIHAKYDRPLFHDSYEESHENMISTHFDALNRTSPREIFGKYEIQFSNHQLEIKTLVPLSWLKSMDRFFPIYIDPTLTLTPDNTVNWTGSVNTWTAGLSGTGPYTSTNIHESFDNRIFLGHACGAGYYDGSSYVGGSGINDANDVVGNGWIRFNTSSVPSGLCVSSIQLNTYVYAGYLTEPGVCRTDVRIRHMALNPVTETNANRLTDIRDGTVYADVSFTGNNNLWRVHNLATTTYNDMLTGSFSIGLETYNTNQSHHEHEYVLMNGYTSSNKPFITVTYFDNIAIGTFTVNGQATNIDACPGQTITVEHTGWNNGGGTVAYWVGVENPAGSGWVTSWSILENACQNQNSCTFTMPNLPTGSRIVVHSNGYNSCGWGPGINRYITINCCATTNAGTLQHQNTVLNLCHGQTVSANNISSTSLNAGNGTLRTVWFVGEWGWTGTAMGWINWRESTPGTPAGGTYSSHLNASVGGGNGDG